MSDSVQTKTVSFIVPAFNEATRIKATLDSIVSEMMDGDELIVVDNGSTDGTHEIVRQNPRAKLMIAPGISVAAMRNLGVLHTSGDVLGFIDGDCTLQSGWRNAAVSILQSEKVGATGCSVLVPDASSWIPKAWRFRRFHTEREAPYLNSGNLVIRRDAYEAVRGFREDLISDEDTDIGKRLTEKGFLIIESPRVSAYHHDNPESLRAFFLKEKWHATSILTSVPKGRPDKAMIMTLIFVLSLMLAAIAVVLGFYQSPTYFLGLAIIGIAPILTSGFRIQKGVPARYFPGLAVLYFLFYVARTWILLKSLLRA